MRRSQGLTSAVIAIASSSHLAHAQICHGTPAHGGIACERGAVSLGNSNGASATIAGSHVAFSVAGRVLESVPTFTSQAADTRLSLQFGGGRFSVCPGLSVGYIRDVWAPAAGRDGPTTLTSHSAAARGGLSVGMEQPIAGGVSVAPFLGGRYAFHVWYLDTKVSNGTAVATGDTVSTAELEYGLAVRRVPRLRGRTRLGPPGFAPVCVAVVCWRDVEQRSAQASGEALNSGLRATSPRAAWRKSTHS